MHRLHPGRWWLLAVQQVQEMSADGILVGSHTDTTIVVGIVVPVKQHGAEGSQKAVCDIPGAIWSMFFCFRQYCPQYGNTGSQNIHRVSACRNCFQYGLNG